MAHQTQPDLFPDGLPEHLAEATVADLPPVLEARELTEEHRAAPSDDTQLELLAAVNPQVPPLPIDALEPLASREPSVPPQPGLGNPEAVARHAAMMDLQQEMAPPEDPADLAPRLSWDRPSTLTYGEVEAKPSLASEELDGEATRILYEIPAPPRPRRPAASPRPRASLSPTAEKLHAVSAKAQAAARAQQQAQPVDATRGQRRVLPSRLRLHTNPTRDLQAVDSERIIEFPRPQALEEDETRDLSAIPEANRGLPVQEHNMMSDEAPSTEHDASHEEATSELSSVRFDWGGAGGLSSWIQTRAAVLALLLLGEAVVLPGYRDGELIAPWTELMTPGSTSFTAGAFFLLLIATLGLPLGARVRLAALGVVSVSLLLFSVLLVGSAVGLDIFDGQPALDALFRGPASLRVILLTGAITLPTALLWRQSQEHSDGARILVGTGIFLVGFCYFGLHKVGLGAGVPAGELMDAGLGSLFLGDRLAAFAAFLPGLVALGCARELIPGFGFQDKTLWAGIFWASVMVPMVLLAFYVASLGEWMAILEPIQVVSTLAAGLLLVPVVLADLLAMLEQRGLRAD